MSVTKEALIDLSSHQENRQVFEESDVLSLGDACQYLRVVMDHFDRYRVYKVRIVTGR